MRIAFVTHECVPFHARTLEERPLGGSETAVIRLAEALHLRGHPVTVFTPHGDPPPSSGPQYVTFTNLNVSRMQECDVLVAVRDWKTLMLPVRADLRLFWTGDSYDVPATFGIGDPRVEPNIDGFLLNSEWHAHELCRRAGVPLEKAWLIGCGVHMPHFHGAETRTRKRLIYSSAPVRGLGLLPRLYERVRARHPDAELHVFAGFETYKDGPGGDLESWHADWRALASVLEALPGCTVHGNVLQEQLAREFMKSSVLAYPNTFNETFCVTAAEAQAAGCAIVTSGRAALSETVGEAGVLIAGLPGSRRYEEDFVDAIDRLLADDDFFGRLSSKGIARASAHFDWNVIARRFEQYLVDAVERKRAIGRTSRSMRENRVRSHETATAPFERGAG
jgi:glycosyltransferase involved in cell wall biosynthesis